MAREMISASFIWVEGVLGGRRIDKGCLIRSGKYGVAIMLVELCKLMNNVPSLELNIVWYARCCPRPRP